MMPWDIDALGRGRALMLLDGPEVMLYCSLGLQGGVRRGVSVLLAAAAHQDYLGDQDELGGALKEGEEEVDEGV